MQVRLSTDKTDVSIKVWKFPAGEVGVKIEDIQAVKEAIKIYVHLESADSDSIIAAINLSDAVKRVRKDLPEIPAVLAVKYLPYSRQDRVCHEGESFALDVFIGILSKHFRWIFTVDVHSQISNMLAGKYNLIFSDIPQCNVASNLPTFDYFIAPDAGASAKIDQHYQVEFGETQVVQLSKTRKDGKVIYEDLKPDTIQGTVCVVDDLADGSATFIALGEMIRRTQSEVKELSLYVTHGLFTNADNFLKLKEMYDTIYVSNMMNDKFKNHVKEI